MTYSFRVVDRIFSGYVSRPHRDGFVPEGHMAAYPSGVVGRIAWSET